MPINIVNVVDLPPYKVQAIGEIEDFAQQFELVETPIRMRSYTARITGAVPVGVHVAEVVSPLGQAITSNPVAVTPAVANDVLIDVELRGAAFSKFAVRLRRIGDLPVEMLIAAAAAEVQAAADAARADQPGAQTDESAAAAPESSESAGAADPAVAAP